MNKATVETAMDVLSKLFYSDCPDDLLAMKTLELYIEMGLLNHEKWIAQTMIRFGSASLLGKIQLFDVIQAEKIEQQLKEAL